MSSGINPLVWMMALSMPGAAQALGLGDIHVDSGLNERLAAEIEIVGATPLELAELKAAVANRETFLHYGAERPAFLASTTFRVAQDVHGRPVLAVRSTETFTEPVVNFLVDLNWRNGQLIRQYTLLLDPAGFGPASPATAAGTVAVPQTMAAPTVTAAPFLTAAPAPVAVPTLAAAPAMEAAPAVTATPTAQSNPTSLPRTARKTSHVKVGAKATLRGIAWRVGERSEPDIERTMIAIFRANPAAFDGNINRLHRGATLTIPSRAEAALISLTDARHEIQAQMAAWHSPAHALAANRAAPSPVAPASGAPAPVAATDTPAADVSAPGPSTPTPAMPSADARADAAATALDHRVESLEQALSRLQGLMQSERDQLAALQRQTARTAVASPAALPAAAAVPSAVADPRTQLKSMSWALGLIVAGFAVVGAVLAAAYLRLRRRLSMARDSRPVAEPERADAPAADEAHAAAAPSESARDDAQVPAPDVTDLEATHPALPRLQVETAGRSEVSATPLPGSSDDTVVIAPHDTVNLMVDTVNLRMNETHLDYNFLDLEQTAQHVQMPSVLNQHVVVKERRTNLADVLKMAIEREPDRHDLRMKLIELYYSAAATNRKAFLDVVQKLARERDHMQPEQWDKIAFMGRQIAAENPLFSEQTDDEDLADCA